LVLGLAAADVLITLWALTWTQIEHWSEDRSLYEHALAVTLDNYVAHHNLALALLADDEDEAALQHLNRALEIRPNSVAFRNRGTLYVDLGNYAAALKDFDVAIARDPNNVDGYTRRASVFASAPDARWRNGKQALEDARRACELSDWSNPEALNALAAAYAESGDFEKALQWQITAITLAMNNRRLLPDARERMTNYHDGKPFYDKPNSSGKGK